MAVGLPAHHIDNLGDPPGHIVILLNNFQCIAKVHVDSVIPGHHMEIHFHYQGLAVINPERRHGKRDVLR